MMHISKKRARVVKDALDYWQENGLLSQGDSARLKESLHITAFDWKRVGKYAFWMAIACVVISISSILADEWLLELFQQLFNAPDSMKCLSFVALAATLYTFGIRRKEKHPGKYFSNEAIFFLGTLSTAFAIAFLGKAFDSGSGHFSLLLLLAAIIYGALGLWFPSKLVWIFSLLSLGSWFGAETGYASGWGTYYLGMNYPLRFVLFGLILIFAGSFLFRNLPARLDFVRSTRAMGLFYLFIALWILSIFGNYSDPDLWARARQIELFHWSILFAAASIAAIYHGIKYDDGMTRGFGLTFLFINLYTRFFEYFWDNTHKALFFGLLAASFWYLGSRAEQIWQLSLLKNDSDNED